MRYIGDCAVCGTPGYWVEECESTWFPGGGGCFCYVLNNGRPAWMDGPVAKEE